MVLEQITGFINLVFLPFTIFPAVIAIFLVSVLLTLLIIGLNRVFINKNVIKEIKTRMEETRDNLTKAQKENNKENTQKFLNELMKTNSTYMKHTFKTLIISLVIISIFLPWLANTYEGLTVASLPFSFPFIGTELNWLYWYALVSLTIGWVARKMFGAEI